MLAIIAGTSYTFWDILLPSIEDAVVLMRITLETKDFFMWTKYLGQ